MTPPRTSNVCCATDSSVSWPKPILLGNNEAQHTDSHQGEYRTKTIDGQKSKVDADNAPSSLHNFKRHRNIAANEQDGS